MAQLIKTRILSYMEFMLDLLFMKYMYNMYNRNLPAEVLHKLWTHLRWEI